MKHIWDMKDSLDLLTWYNIWPDSIEDGMMLLDYAYKHIESFPGDGEERIKYNKQVVKNSFDKNYEKS
jgi:hypothetical protein